MYILVLICVCLIVINNRVKMCVWLGILLIIGKSRLRLSTEEVQDMKLKSDYHKESKYNFLNAIFDEFMSFMESLSAS